jgi:hypothetical protein
MIELRVWLWLTWFVISNWVRGDAILPSIKPPKETAR